MARCHLARTAELPVKDGGSDNGCSVVFASGEVNVILPFRRRAPRAGLRGSRNSAHTTVDRFWSRVQKDPGGCWLFAGAPCNQAGHIHVTCDDGARVYAHRFSYALHHGPIPQGMCVLHRCDVPRCVNPEHLFLGTQRDNVHDAIKKGRFQPWARRVRHAVTLRLIRDGAKGQIVSPVGVTK